MNDHQNKQKRVKTAIAEPVPAVQPATLASLITLTDADAAAFTSIHAAYIARFVPRDQVEHDIVEEIAYFKWQIRQLWMYETSLLGLQMARDENRVASDWEPLGEIDRRALAYAASLQNGSALADIQRRSRSLAAQATRSIKSLVELQKLPLPPACQPPASQERNEPSPISEHRPDRSQPAPQAPRAPAAIVEYVTFLPGRPRISLHAPAPPPRVLSMTAGGPC